MKRFDSILPGNRYRLLAIVLLFAVAIFGVVRYVDTSQADAQAAATTASRNTDTTAASRSASSGGGSCCAVGPASGSSGAVEGTATVTGGVQRISVEVDGGYSPAVINLEAGVPAEITFGQSSGCTAFVQSQMLGFQADLRRGPQTIALPALEPGTYDFECGMSMVFGEIVVR